MSTDPLPLVAAGVVAVLSGAVSWLSTRTKSNADVAGELVESSIAMVRELRLDVASLRAAIDAAESEVAECERRNSAMQHDIDSLQRICGGLTRHLAALGIPPPEDDQ